MQRTLFHSALFAATVGFSSLAFAAAGAQATDTPIPPSSGQVQHGMHHGMWHHRGDQRGGMGELSKRDRKCRR